MTPRDVARLDQLRAHGEANPLGAETVLGIVMHGEPSAVKRDARHRAFLSDGVVAVFSVEDYTKLNELPDAGPFTSRGWVRHLSVSRQRRVGPAVVSQIPSSETVDLIAVHLGFTPAAVVFPSPDVAGPFIQHVLEDYLESRERA